METVKHFSINIPLGAVIGIIAVVFFSGAFLYLLATFLHSWIKNGFSEGIKTLEENAAKVGKLIAAPFAILYMIVGALLEKMPFKNAGEFFAWFAAADLEVWRDMPSPVRKKRTAFGILIFITLAVTSFLAGKVWGEIFGSFGAGVFIGCLWFAMMWALDRTIISLLDNQTGKSSMIIVFTRLMMIFAISYINTTFIAMEIYHTAIANQIVMDKKTEFKHFNDSMSVVKTNIQTERDQLTADVNTANDGYGAWLAGEQKKIDDKRASLADHYQEFIGETAGRSGSHLKGWGDAARADTTVMGIETREIAAMVAALDSTKNQGSQYMALQDAKADLEKRDPELVAQLDSAGAFLAQKQLEIDDRKQDGYGERTDAMWKQAAKRPFSFFMVFMMFFTFEAIAVLTKVVSGEDNYNQELALRKRKHAAEHQYQASIEMQSKSNDYTNTMNTLINTGLTNEISANALRKAAQDQLHNGNVDRIKQTQKQIAEIDALVTPIADKNQRETVKKSLVQKLMSTFGVLN